MYASLFYEVFTSHRFELNAWRIKLTYTASQLEVPYPVIELAVSSTDCEDQTSSNNKYNNNMW